jgi:Replication initiator protein, pSAM2
VEPQHDRPVQVRWGSQLEVRVLEAGEGASCAGYIAKYATKSTEACGGLVHRLSAEDLETLRVRPHVRRLVQCAWGLAAEPELHDLRLRRWAHALGFRGHCFTKSRHYSTTFTALRRARHEHQLRRAHGGEPRDPWDRPRSEGACVEERRWSFAGVGYRTPGDAWLAETGAARAREARRVARKELWAAGSGAVPVGEVQRGRRSR